MPNKSFIKRLLERRIPHILGSYLVAGTSLILFIEYLVDKYQFPSHYPTLSLFALMGILPSVVILSYFHGAPGKDEWTKVEKVGIPINVFFIATILFFGDSMGFWKMDSDSSRDEIKNSHLLYISSPKNDWLNFIKDYIEVSSYLSQNIGHDLYQLDEIRLNEIRKDMESKLLSEFYKQDIEIKVIKETDELDYFQYLFDTLDNDRHIADSLFNYYDQPNFISFLYIYSIKNKDNNIIQYFIENITREMPGWDTYRSYDVYESGKLESSIFEVIEYCIDLSIKNPNPGYVTKVDGDIIYINPGELELQANMNLLGVNIYNLHDKNSDGYTDKDSDWNIQVDDWERALSHIESSNNYTSEEISIINNRYSKLMNDSLKSIYRGHYYSENRYTLNVSDVIDSTVIAKLIELSNPWVEIRKGDVIFLE